MGCQIVGSKLRSLAAEFLSNVKFLIEATLRLVVVEATAVACCFACFWATV